MERIRSIWNVSALGRLVAALSAWFGAQWASSRAVEAFLAPSPRSDASGRGSLFYALWQRWRDGLSGLYDRLGLERVFGQSMFCQTWFWCVLPAVLAPMMPTMALAALTLAAFGAMLLNLLRFRERQAPGVSANRYILLYALIYFIGTIASVSLKDSLPAGLLTVLFVLYALVLQSALTTRRELDVVVELLVLAGTAVALYGLYQYVFRTGYQSSSWVDASTFGGSFRVVSTLENPNMLGQYLLLVIPLGGACLLTADNWKKRALWFACCGVMCLCMLLTLSRGAWLGLLLAGAVFFAILSPRLLLLAPVALAGLYVVLPNTVIRRFASIGNLADSSTNYRVSVWRGTLRMLGEWWPCGVGPGTEAFNKIYPQYSLGAAFSSHGHNLFLQITADAGIFALLVFLLTLFWYFKDLCGAVRREGDGRSRMLQIAFLSGMCGFMVQAMTDYSFYNFRVMFVFWTFLAVGLTAARRSRMPQGERPW